MIYDKENLITSWRTAFNSTDEPFKPYDFKSFECKCGCGKTIEDVYFVDFMNYLYAETNKLFVINSGMRCLAHNKKVGGVPTSDHTKGLAIDCATPTMEDRSLLVYHAFRFGIKRAIIYVHKKFVHLSINYDTKLTAPLLIFHEEIIK